MSAMRILFISNEYPPDTGFGGIATYSRHAAEGLADRGHEVHVICRSVTGKSCSATENGVTIHRMVPGPYPLPSARIFFPVRKVCYRSIPQSLVRLSWAETASRACARLIDECGVFDIIEYPECGAEGYYISRMRRHHGCMTIARLHTPWEIIRSFDNLKEPPFDALLQSYLERVTVRRSSGISAPSRAIADRLSRPWRLKPVTVYPNPLGYSPHQARTGSDWIYLGRVERRKGVHILVKAYAAVCSKHSPPPLRLLGRPYGRLACGRLYGDYIRDLIGKLGMGGKIEWIEGVSHTSVPDYLGRSSTAFFPSLWENFSYACLEAQASGCAVVASNCGGFPEMIMHDKTGLLVEPDNVETLADAMELFLADSRLSERLGTAARKHISSYCDRSTVCARAEDFYRSVIARGNHG